MPGTPGTDRDATPPHVLLDSMCGSLATYLRMCGYDAAYALDRGVEADDRLQSLAAAEGRVLITRDHELAARTTDAVLLTERDVIDQLRELVNAGYPVSLAAEPTRCGSCNGAVERVDGTGDEDGDWNGDRDANGDGDGGDDANGDSDGVGDANGDEHSRGDATPGVDRPDYVPDPGPESPDRFWRCRECGQWFWKGGHWESVGERLRAL